MPQMQFHRSDLLDLSDAEAGKLFKQFISEIDDWANKEWSDKSRLVVGLSFMSLAQLVKQAHDSNAAELKMTLSDVILEGKTSGDWLLTLRRLNMEKGADSAHERKGT
jgi:hypothetical protein